MRRNDAQSRHEKDEVDERDEYHGTGKAPDHEFVRLNPTMPALGIAVMVIFDWTGRFKVLRNIIISEAGIAGLTRKSSEVRYPRLAPNSHTFREIVPAPFLKWLFQQ